MKRLALLCLVAPAFMYAEGLKELINFATSNNSMIASKTLTQQSKIKDLESSQSAYYPTVDLGGAYQSLNSKSGNIPGDIYSGYAKIGIDLYDGGRKSNTVKQNKALLNSSGFDTLAYKKSLALSISEDFYNIKSVESSLRASQEKSKQLKAELQRIKKFYEVGSATKDEIDKLQAAFSNNVYTIESIRFEILSLKKLLSIKIGKKITTLDNSTIVAPANTSKELSDKIKSLKEKSSSLTYVAKKINASYLPQIRLEDTYTFYDYDRSDTSHPKGLDNQNKFMLTFNIRLFDNGNVKKQKESILIQKKALDAQIQEVIDTQAINIELALRKIQTIKAQINSSKISLKSAISAYKMITQKYQAGSVDNIAYLDALSVKTDAQSQYEEALNNLQISYVRYYYYINKNIKEFIK